MAGWAVVQRMWRKGFFPDQQDLDVLEHRKSCGSCTCLTTCSNREDAGGELSATPQRPRLRPEAAFELREKRGSAEEILPRRGDGRLGGSP